MSELSGPGDVPEVSEELRMPDDGAVSPPELDLGIVSPRHVGSTAVPPELLEQPIVAKAGRMERRDEAADAPLEEPDQPTTPEPDAPESAHPDQGLVGPVEQLPPQEAEQQPEPAAGDAADPPEPPTEQARVTGEDPGEFGIQRFLGETPTPEQVRAAATLFDDGTLSTVTQHQRYVDILPLDERFARLELQREVPGQGSVRISVDLEEASGVRITDSGVIIPNEPTIPVSEDPRRLYALFRQPDGTQAGYAYFKDAEGSIRRRECDLEVFAGLPKDGTMPDRIVYRLLKQRSDEGEAARHEMERLLGIEHPLVGDAEVKYVLGEAALAEPRETYLMRLRNIALRRRLSRSPELEDSKLAGGRFIASVNGFLRDHGYDPASREATSIKIPVIGTVPSGPNEEASNAVMQVQAGKRRDVNGIKGQFVAVRADQFGTLADLAEQAHVTQVLQERNIDLSRQGRISTALVYTLDQGRLRSTLTELLAPLEATYAFTLIPRQTTYADTLEAREIRNFLRKPMI